MELDIITAVLLLTWAVLLLLILAFAGLLRQLRLLEATVLSLPARRSVSHLPSDLLPDHVFDAGHPRAALLFVDPSCDSCYPVMAGASDLAEGHPDTRIIIVPLSGKARFESDNSVMVLQAGGISLASALSIPATPFGVLLDADGSELRRGPVGSSEQLELLLSDGVPTKGVVGDGIHA